LRVQAIPDPDMRQDVLGMPGVALKLAAELLDSDLQVLPPVGAHTARRISSQAII
jgi:hypothetical protein